MIDYTTELKNFIQDNFTPGTKDAHAFGISNSDLLEKLYSVFPVKSIGDHELTEVLNELGYKRTVTTDSEFNWMFNHKKKPSINIKINGNPKPPLFTIEESKQLLRLVKSQQNNDFINLQVKLKELIASAYENN